MTTIEEIQKIFEFKPDIWQFLNSPLFVLIVIIVVVTFVVGWAVIIRRRNRKVTEKKDTKKKLRFRRKDKEKEEPEEESSDGEEPVAPEPDKQKMIFVEPKVNYKISQNECIVIAQDKDFVTVLFNKDGTPEIKKLSLSEREYKHDLTAIRRKPEYHPYVPETERAIPLEKPRDDGMVKKVLRYSPDDVGDVEREVDELLVKKKPNFLSRMTIPRWERTMKIKKKEEETAVEQTETTDVKRQLTEKEVFEDDESEDKEPEKQEAIVEQQKEGKQPTRQEGESKRHVVLKLLEQGKSKDEILKTTGYTESTVAKYTTDWTDNQLSVARKLIADGRWSLVKKLVEILDKKETFLVEDGKLYYPGRDKLTYVFLATTVALAIVAIAEGYFLWLS